MGCDVMVLTGGYADAPSIDASPGQGSIASRVCNEDSGRSFSSKLDVSNALERICHFLVRLTMLRVEEAGQRRCDSDLRLQAGGQANAGKGNSMHGGMAIDVSYQQTLFIHKQQTSSLDKAKRILM